MTANNVFTILAMNTTLNRRRYALLALATLAVGAAAPLTARAEGELAAKIDAVIDSEIYKHSKWGILVVDADSGETVYARNPETLCFPASVTKLYSCAAALVAYGPDYRFTTPVYRRGAVKEGTLSGDLILVAQGDLTLGGRNDNNGGLAFKDHDHTYANWLNTNSELTDTDPLAGLTELARQVYKAGIHRVDGDVLIDDRLFPRARGSGSGPDVLSPIVINDNTLDVTITPAAEPGQPASITVRPATDFIQVDARVETAARGTAVTVSAERVAPFRYTIRGHVPAGGKPVLRICPVDDPGSFARALFIRCLQNEGVTVTASAFRPPTAELPEKDAYSQLARVASFSSPPLSELLKVTLKVSHNLYASTLPLLLAVQEGKHSLADGLRREGQILAKLGVDVPTISFESGAGGGNGDRVTARTTVQLLRAMSKRPDFASYEAALPVLGVDGTLADAVSSNSLARGNVRAKTGTYGDADLLNNRMLLRSKAIAGYVTTETRRKLVFAIFVNDVPLARGANADREGKALGQLCEILYRNVR
jgi:D-alanyl-D-alanine carboxypeptidase/D-alanyl-D-alanine-endopeptidase (penicillin-binding protein 4)